MKAKDGIVVIKDTTKAAFEDFVGFHYEKKIEFNKRTLKELFEILNLAEKYQTKELHDKVDRQIKHFPLTMESVVKVASITQEFSQFNNLSENLYTRCVVFIEEHCATVPTILTLIQGNEDKVTVMALLQDMKATQIPPKPQTRKQDDCSKCNVQESKTCFNCNQKPCRKGTPVGWFDSFRPGTRLRSLNLDLPTSWREKYRNRLCILISRSGEDVKITWPDPPVPHDPDVSDPYQTPISTGFVYACGD